MPKIVWKIACLWMGFSVFFLGGCQGANEEEELPKELILTQEEAAPREEPQEVMVYVCGEVVHPGVYSLPQESRIQDALEAAGGMAEGAAPTYLNQAQRVLDGEKIYVPSREEVKSGSLPQGDGLGEGKVSLNQGSLEELMTLPGIGEAKAQAILDYRQSQGGFSSLEELMQVDGIKEGTYKNLQERIRL